MTRPRRRRSRVVLAVLALGLLLLSAEVVVRATGVVDVRAAVRTPAQAEYNARDMFVAIGTGERAYANRPGARAVVDGVVYEHDEHGRRVTPRPGGGPPRGPRVAFLGDSTTYGWGLPADATLPAQVARALPMPIVPLNHGVNGYALVQHAALYEDRRATLDAPLVVLVFFPNDLVPGGYLWDGRLDLLYLDALPLPGTLKPWLWRSALYRALVSGHTERLRAQGALDPRRPENHAEPLAALRRLARAVEEDGRTLVVAHLPAMEELDPYAFAGGVAAVAQVCRDEGVPFVDLLPAFLEDRERQIAAYEARTGRPVDEAVRRHYLSRYWLVDPHDHHLDAEATGIAARALAEALEPHLR